MSILAKNIRLLRQRASLSQQALAEKLGLNRGNIASYEKALAEPKVENLINMAKFFNTTVDKMVANDLDKLNQDEIELSKSHDESFSFTALNGSQDATYRFRVQNFKQRVIELEQMLGGFQEYHRFRMSGIAIDGVTQKDLERLSDDYERLMEILEAYIGLGKELFPQTHSFPATDTTE